LGWFFLAILNIFFFQASQANRLEKMKRSAAASEPPRPGDPLGRLSIPRIGLSAIVAEGDDENTLRHAVGHIPGSAFPADSVNSNIKPGWSHRTAENIGNIALAAHRDTFFRPLKRVQPNDLIVLETPRGKYQYKVARIAIVKPERIDLLQPSAKSQLTLVTCFPFRYIGPAPERFVVQAFQIPTQQASW